MENITDQSSPILDAVQRLIHSAVEFLPQLSVAILVLVVGWIVARLLRALTLRLAKGADRLARSAGLTSAMEARKLRVSSAAILSEVVYWVVILIVIAVATNQLGLRMFAHWLDQLVSQLPNILSGIAIIVAGVVIANLVKDAIVAFTQSMPRAQGEALARVAQVVTLIVLALMGIDQIGIDVTVVSTVVAIVVGAFLGGLSLAFGIGARAVVGNLLGMRYLGSEYRIGERIRIDGIEGTVVEKKPTALLIETSEGLMKIPGQRFGESSTLLVRE